MLSSPAWGSLGRWAAGSLGRWVEGRGRAAPAQARLPAEERAGGHHQSYSARPAHLARSGLLIGATRWQRPPPAADMVGAPQSGGWRDAGGPREPSDARGQHVFKSTTHRRLSLFTRTRSARTAIPDGLSRAAVRPVGVRNDGASRAGRPAGCPSHWPLRKCESELPGRPDAPSWDGKSEQCTT